jgi:hypothetical protein
MCAHIAECVTSMEASIDAMTLAVYMIDLISHDRVKLCAFDLSSPVYGHYDDFEWSWYAIE